MTTSEPERAGRRRLVRVMAAAMGLTLALAGSGIVAGGQADVADVRRATLKYHDLSAALADGYVLFYECTEQPGVGTMGQHFVNLPLVTEEPGIDPFRPEVLVYAPKRNGEWKLVAVEYVTLAPIWEGQFGSATPRVLGQDLLFREEGNRYGLPDFWERHAWIWQGNPRGLFDDWNPSISCLGTGDNGG
jgi:hypothetical protein